MKIAIRLLLCFVLICSEQGVARAVVEDVCTDNKNAAQRAEQLALMMNSGIGSLSAITRNGAVACPLKHTSVIADISGYVARVTVEQTYTNPLNESVEAIYTFPLPDDSAVDKMSMIIGNREIKGVIKLKEEAKRIYETAKNQGKATALLEGERPNIFTQSVGNLQPNCPVKIQLQYVQLLSFSSGSYSFVFPTVIGPRFIPGVPVAQSGSGWSPDTRQVPDASRITPPVAQKGRRSGHDISIVVNVNAGMKVGSIESSMHEISVQHSSPDSATVSLKKQDEIPNRDFILNWQVSENTLTDGYVCHKNGKDGYFALMIVPPAKVIKSDIAPRELVFVVDTSGSMSGEPIAKVREAMDYAIDGLNSKDSFRIITFANSVRAFDDAALPATPQNKDKAHGYIRSLQGAGGTWMAPAVETACKLPAADNRLRIVSLMSDGFIGNDTEIITMVRQLRQNSRWFPFGVGSSVNRYLIDGIASAGGGIADFVLLNSDGKSAAEKFYKRIATPVLTDVRLKFEGVQVSEVSPAKVADVWEQRPLYFVGKYAASGKGYAVLTGFRAGKPYSKRIPLDFPSSHTASAAIPSIWARSKISEIEAVPILAKSELGKQAITKLALEHHLVTDRTSFVAVEEKTITEPGKANRKLVVPVDMPQGVSWEAYENDPAGATNFGQLRLGGYPTGNSYSKYASPRRGARFDFAPNTFGGEVFAKRHPNKLGFDVIYGGRVPFDKLVINGGGAGAMIGLSPSAKLSTAFKAGQQSIAVRVPDPKKLDDQLQALLVNALIDDSFSNSSVRVLVEFTESPNMLTDLEKLGMKDGRVVHNNIIGIIPMSKLAMICDLPNIKLIKLER